MPLRIPVLTQEPVVTSQLPSKQTYNPIKYVSSIESDIVQFNIPNRHIWEIEAISVVCPNSAGSNLVIEVIPESWRASNNSVWSDRTQITDLIHYVNLSKNNTYSTYTGGGNVTVTNMNFPFAILDGGWAIRLSKQFGGLLTAKIAYREVNIG